MNRCRVSFSYYLSDCSSVHRRSSLRRVRTWQQRVRTHRQHLGRVIVHISTHAHWGSVYERDGGRPRSGSGAENEVADRDAIPGTGMAGSRPLCRAVVLHIIPSAHEDPGMLYHDKLTSQSLSGYARAPATCSNCYHRAQSLLRAAVLTTFTTIPSTRPNIAD